MRALLGAYAHALWGCTNAPCMSVCMLCACIHNTTACILASCTYLCACIHNTIACILASCTHLCGDLIYKLDRDRWFIKDDTSLPNYRQIIEIHASNRQPSPKARVMTSVPIQVLELTNRAR